jgi:diguanylate cyclase (GGDEF)-like protein
MLSQENVIGVLNVSHSAPNAFSTEEIRLLSILAEQAAVTIERGEAMRSLEQLAITDGLTRVFNHRYFRLRLDQEIRRARRYQLPLSLLMIDVDHFKAINDRCGHETGNRILIEVAGILRRNMRETEIVTRYGGEEFALILPQTRAEDALVPAERVRRLVEEHPFAPTDGTPLSVTISVGVAGYPEHAAAPEELLQQADAALYAAKEEGRNRVRIARVRG